MQKYALYSCTPDGKPQRNQKGVNRMNITKITVKKIEGQQTLRGVASVVSRHIPRSFRVNGKVFPGGTF